MRAYRMFRNGWLAALALVSGLCSAANFSDQATFTRDDEVRWYEFGVDGAGMVDVMFETISYGGGTLVDGLSVGPGGFDSILSVFDAHGVLMHLADDNFAADRSTDPNTGASFDARLNLSLPAGRYFLAASQFENFPSGDNLSDGFSREGASSFTREFGCSNGQFCDVSEVDEFNNRTGNLAVNAYNVAYFRLATASAVPLPHPIVLLVSGLFAVGARCGQRRPAVCGNPRSG